MLNVLGMVVEWGPKGEEDPQYIFYSETQCRTLTMVTKLTEETLVEICTLTIGILD